MGNANKEAWKQFIQNKIGMLQDFHTAKVRSSSFIVQTSHGDSAEGIFRAWLESFLPKRYGVTSGYIISQGNLGDIPLSHFDVIIYDQLSSPILWLDQNPDYSAQGKSRAIPVEYILGVIEVKSKLTPQSVDKALAKLKELDPFLAKVDDSNDRYKLYLPEAFFSWIVFFEIDKTEASNFKLLDKFVTLRRDFIGAVILSGKGNDENLTGRIIVFTDNKEIKSTEEDNPSLLGWGFGTSFKIGDGYVTTMITWSEAHFSIFAFDILALLNGTYQPGLASSFHGLGVGISTTPKNSQ